MIINWGDAPFKAFISVTYPTGTCTVSGNGQSYTHSGGGTTTFTVKKKGTYTVKGVDNNGVEVASNSVDISKSNETKSVTLKYVLNIINGSTVHSVCGGLANVGIKTNQYEQTWTPVVAYGSGYTRITNGSGWTGGSYPAGVTYTKNKIDLTGYTKFVVSGSAYGERDNSYIYCGVLSSQPTSSSCPLATYLTGNYGKKTTTLSNSSVSISSLSGKYYLCLMRGYSPGYITITSIRLE